MDSSVLVFLSGLGGALIGGAASILTTYLSNRHAIKLKREEFKLVDNKDARSFSRDTLVELQQLLTDALRNQAQVHFHYLHLYKSGKGWAKSDVPDDLNNESMVINRKLAFLNERIFDRELYVSIQKLRSMINDVNMFKSFESSQAQMIDCGKEAYEVFQKIGEELRATFNY